MERERQIGSARARRALLARVMEERTRSQQLVRSADLRAWAGDRRA
jgi:hypothetical protein